MTQPNKFRYMSTNYDIVFDSTGKSEEGMDYYGRVLYNKLRIIISPTLVKGQQQWTMLHEILHIINSGAGGDMTEGQIDSTAAGLLEAFRQNPWLYDYIKKE